MVKLFLKTQNDGSLRYGVNVWYRAAYAVFGLILFGGTYLSRDQVPFSWFSFPMVFVYFCLFAAAYEERWVFSVSRRSIHHRYGVLFLAKTHEYSLDDVDRLRLRQFRKGGFGSAQVKGGTRRAHLSLQLVMKQGEPVRIEDISRRRSSGQTEQAAEGIAGYLGLPLELDT